ncbi:hypothetical protein H2200_010170 [Cladophialophora chaetospira]|uniref:Zn(2)-C6 fungal-type domain-containing protein n=1 Tax=Cladophialophora chaetospira TaxID=386627 RepID=A0AA39CEN5_9EURO|nr:hypothetical protein H2200_010170 [Cladophialophora chaetospira]
MDTLQAPRPFKPRRPHKKSRNGCKYCRRRRIKCDETKPSCLRCLHRRQPCEYFTQIQEYEVHSERDSGTEPLKTDESIEDVFNIPFITPSPSMSPIARTPAFLHSRTASSSGNEMSFEALNDTVVEQPLTSMYSTVTTLHKDLYLFDHYMDHTCCDLEIIPNVSFARKFGIPQLAVGNPGILCSLMALGAACLSIDILTGQAPKDQVQDLGALISTGDRYHQIGLQSVRHQMNTNQPRDLAEVHAHAILLFPYALARRRISSLLNDIGPPTPTSGVDGETDHLSCVDWMIILRGVTTTGRACWSNSTVYMDDSILHNRLQNTHPAIASHLLTKLSEPRDRPSIWKSFQCQIASKHPLFPVVASTRVVALEALQARGEKVNRLMRVQHKFDPPMDIEKSSLQMARSASLSACIMATDLLANLDGTIFDPGSVVEPCWPNFGEGAGPSLIDSPIPWLRRYASPPIYDPAQPALRTVFAWVNRTPEEYFQLLLKPLPPQSESPPAYNGQTTTPDVDREIQLLAWDIWAHWLVFAILIEDESSFTASLGVPEITNLAPWFRNGATESPGSKPGSPTSQNQDWWPWSMCSVAQQLRRYHQ